MPPDEGAVVDFPRVPSMEARVDFWRHVYGIYSENEIAFHDPSDMRFIYRVVQVPSKETAESSALRRKAINLEQGQTLKALKRLSELESSKQLFHQIKPEQKAAMTQWTQRCIDEPVMCEIYERTKHLAEDGTVLFRDRHIRAQNGLRERFIKGYISSGAYAARIRRILRGAGLPDSIISLAFLESLMQIDAHSWAGAVGIWQFMRYTAGEYMTVSEVIDERRDPILATHAAAQYLIAARNEVGPWPLAITSYNFGRAGVKNMVKAAKSDQLDTLILEHKSKRWGFAAQNYYLTFLAVLDLVQHPHIYFPEVEARVDPWRFDVFRLPLEIRLKRFLEVTALEQSDVSALNLALRPQAFEDDAWLPYGYGIRVPAGSGEGALKKLIDWMTQQKSGEAKSEPKASGEKYKIRRGDTLSGIAHKMKVSLSSLMRINKLNKKSVLRIGKRLKIPQDGQDWSLELSSTEETGPQDYRVSRGDSLLGIAHTFQVPITHLLEANDMSMATRLEIGQVLNIPQRTFGYSLIPSAKDLQIWKPAHTQDGLSIYVSRYEESLQPDTELGFRFSPAEALPLVNWVKP